ncbi:MAG TPA: hypothetical protein VF614_00280 [Chthoniobacteraceae bacterium]|jgi:hypothetical protein
MAFPRPKKKHAPPPWRNLPPREDPLARTDEVSRPHPQGTVIALVGILATGLMMTGKLPSEVARFAAIGTGVSLAASAFMDLKLGFKNLIRADLMAILAFYFLTLFEFLFPQQTFDTMIGPRLTHESLVVVLVGFAGLLIGRHMLKARGQPFADTLNREVPAAWLIVVFWVCFSVGYIHMFLAVNFDIVEMIEYFMAPRFSQPWQRGKFGDWKALLVELGLFIYLVPPLAGIMLARRKRYPFFQLVLVTAALLFTFFYGFAGGTRNVFAAYLITFLIGYAFALAPGRRKELIILSAASAVIMLAATVFMLQFRSVGFKNFLIGNYEHHESKEQVMFVDYNLYAIGKLVEVFPKYRPYLGLEVPYLALIRPIPRAVWPGKPEGLSASIEDALGVEGLTIAASFAGEAYMAGGSMAVFLIAIFFGAITGWWSYLSSSRNSELGILIYASGFFAAVISMRSLFVFTTALMPTVAAIMIGTYSVRKLAAKARQWGNRRAMTRPLPRPPRQPVS